MSLFKRESLLMIFCRRCLVQEEGGSMLDVILKRFEKPDEVRTFEKGKFEIVHLGGMTIGRATYLPGWKWSQHVGPNVGKNHCDIEHVAIAGAGDHFHLGAFSHMVLLIGVWLYSLAQRG